MKKIVLLISISFITFSIFIAMNTSRYCTNMGTITTKEVKLRKSADETSIVLELINTNEQVEIIEKIDEWYKVKYKKITGYVHEDYVKVNEGNINSNSKDNQKESTDENINENTKAEETLQIGNKVKLKSDQKLYIRPLINSKEVLVVKQGQDVQVIQILNGWLYIDINGVNGWIRKDNLTTNKQQDTTESSINKEGNKTESTTTEKKENNLNKTGYVKSDGINFRENKNTSSQVLRVLSQNAKLTIISEDGDWYKVKFKEETGYILKMYVSDKKVDSTSRSNIQRTEKISTQVKESKDITTDTNKTTSTNLNNSKGQQVADYVKTFLGCKYVYGGSSPTKGFDCSGLTMYVYKKFGINLSHSATAQSKVGTKVDKSDLQVGDLVFFSDYKTYKGIGHCGIYIGNNKFIHASTERTGVITSSLTSSAYQKRYVTATRIF